MNKSFIVNIAIKDRDGRVVGQKQVIKYEGVLAAAHEHGLRSISTELVQVPCKANDNVAIARAVVVTCRGTFEGIGDASPANVNARVANALIRVAETRAKARALRDAVNIGIVALDELEDVDEVQPTRETSPTASNTSAAAHAPEAREVREAVADLMTSAQRRLLFRIAAERGVASDDIARWLENHNGLKALSQWGKAEASRLIERLKGQNGNGGQNGHAGSTS
jgi:hypothetical protein